ncbi:MAG: ABC transporter ATP-binding protein [Candidatus Saccharimonadales bacterium]
MDNALVTTKLSKKYSGANEYALKDLTLQVQPGEVYGFLGPNGAGKSTTIRTLMNFIQPTSGSAKILGHDIVKDSVKIKREIGYLAGDGAVYSKMTGRQFLEYLGDLQPPATKAYQHGLAKRLQATLDKPLGSLSRGNRQKISIIQAFMHQPKLLILDEPSSGLDPLMQEVFYELINESKARGAAVFMSSHILGEVQKICDRVGIIRDGRLIAERNIDEMAQEAAQTFDLIFKEAAPLSKLRKLSCVQNMTENNPHSVTLHVRGELSPLFALLAQHTVTKIDTRTLDLEEAFMHYYQSRGDKHV